MVAHSTLVVVILVPLVITLSVVTFFVCVILFRHTRGNPSPNELDAYKQDYEPKSQEPRSRLASSLLSSIVSIRWPARIINRFSSRSSSNDQQWVGVEMRTSCQSDRPSVDLGRWEKKRSVRVASSATVLSDLLSEPAIAVIRGEQELPWPKLTRLGRRSRSETRNPRSSCITKVGHAASSSIDARSLLSRFPSLRLNASAPPKTPPKPKDYIISLPPSPVSPSYSEKPPPEVPAVPSAYAPFAQVAGLGFPSPPVSAASFPSPPKYGSTSAVDDEEPKHDVDVPQDVTNDVTLFSHERAYISPHLPINAEAAPLHSSPGPSRQP